MESSTSESACVAAVLANVLALLLYYHMACFEAQLGRKELCLC